MQHTEFELSQAESETANQLEFNIFDHSTSTVSNERISISEHFQKVRSEIYSGTPKSKRPVIVPQVICRNNSKKQRDISLFTGLFFIDIDLSKKLKDSPAMNSQVKSITDRMFTALSDMKSTVFASRSVSGKGIHCLVSVDISDVEWDSYKVQTFKTLHTALRFYIRDYLSSKGVVVDVDPGSNLFHIDRMTENPVQQMFISSDKDAYLNESPEPIDGLDLSSLFTILLDKGLVKKTKVYKANPNDVYTNKVIEFTGTVDDPDNAKKSKGVEIRTSETLPIEGFTYDDNGFGTVGIGNPKILVRKPAFVPYCTNPGFRKDLLMKYGVALIDYNRSISKQLLHRWISAKNLFNEPLGKSDILMVVNTLWKMWSNNELVETVRVYKNCHWLGDSTISDRKERNAIKLKFDREWRIDQAVKIIRSEQETYGTLDNETILGVLSRLRILGCRKQVMLLLSGKSVLESKKRVKNKPVTSRLYDVVVNNDIDTSKFTVSELIAKLSELSDVVVTKLQVHRFLKENNLSCKPARSTMSDDILESIKQDISSGMKRSQVMLKYGLTRNIANRLISEHKSVFLGSSKTNILLSTAHSDKPFLDDPRKTLSDDDLHQDITDYIITLYTNDPKSSIGSLISMVTSKFSAASKLDRQELISHIRSAISNHTNITNTEIHC